MVALRLGICVALYLFALASQAAGVFEALQNPLAQPQSETLSWSNFWSTRQPSFYKSVGLPPKVAQRLQEQQYCEIMVAMGYGCRARDPHRAIELFTRAAIRGNPSGKVAIGQAYAAGNGLPRNFELARAWFESAAHDGSRFAEVMLAEVYAQPGKLFDYHRGFESLIRAAAEGSPEAQYSLGQVYQLGHNVKPDLVEALKWLQLSVNAGYKTAAARRDEVRALMDASQREAAAKRVQAFIPQPQSALDVAPALPTVTVPLDPQYRFPAMFLGKTNSALVDTGASVASIDSEYRSYLGDPLLPVYRMTIFSKTITSAYGCPDVDIGGVRFSPLLTTIHQSELGSESDKSKRVILGMYLIRKFVISFDPDRNTFTIGNSVPENIKKNSLALPLEETTRDTYGIWAKVNGKEQILFVIDSGFSGSINLSEVDWQRVFPGRPPKVLMQRAISGDDEIKEEEIARVASVAMGSSVYPNLIASHARSPYSPSSLGRDFLRRHVATLDFPNRTLYLSPSRHFKETDEADMTGLHLGNIDGKILVDTVDKGSPADRAGIRPHDQVISIDGKEMNLLSYGSFIDRFQAGPGVKLHFEILRGNKPKALSLVLKRLL